MYIGHDMPSNTFYSGKIGLVRVSAGQGAYKKTNDFTEGEDKDPFAFVIGIKKLLEGKEEKKEPTEKDKEKVHESHPE